MTSSKTKISNPLVALVEGYDEVKFLPYLLTARGVPEFQFLSYDGKGQLGVFLKTLPSIPGYAQVTGLVIIRDADVNSVTAFQSVRDLLAQAGLPVPTAAQVACAGPPRLAVFISPGNGRTGELEDICLDSVTTDPCMACINTFVACVEGVGHAPLAKPAKAKVQAFLASRSEPLQLLSHGALANHWPFDHASFDSLTAVFQSVL